MANPEHVNVLKQGPGAWNAWRADNPQILPDLCGAFLESVSLDGANLTSARLVRTYLANGYLRNIDLTDANLTDSDLHDANLMGARLTTANLTAADLRDANLQDASLDGATLRRASLARTYLVGASLLWADLTDADMHLTAFDRANVGWTTFGGNDVSRARGLDSLKHHGPSSIGIDTILRSRGTIPEPFLRGGGVPEDFIAYARSLVGQPIHYYSCFISYSAEDQEFADRLYTDLQNRGVRCWFAPHDVKAGRKLNDQIDEAIRLYDSTCHAGHDGIPAGLAGSLAEWCNTPQRARYLYPGPAFVNCSRYRRRSAREAGTSPRFLPLRWAVHSGREDYEPGLSTTAGGPCAPTGTLTICAGTPDWKQSGTGLDGAMSMNSPLRSAGCRERWSRCRGSEVQIAGARRI